MLDASPEEQAKWWASLSAEDRKYLIEGEGEDGPFAEDLMSMDGGIPESAQEQAKQHLQELAKADIPVYTEIRQGLHRSQGCLGPRRRGGGHRRWWRTLTVRPP